MGEFEHVLGDALAPECVTFVGLGHKAGPEPVHGFGLELGAEAVCGFGAGAEAVWVSQRLQQWRLVIPSYGPALMRLEFETSAARTQRQDVGLVLETEESEMPEAEG